MKKTITQINKDLDLRRFGKNVYSKAMSEGGKESGEGGNSGNDMDFINQAVNIIKNSYEVIPVSINAWDNIKSQVPETIEKIGDENNADYVIMGVSPIPDTEEINFTAIFLTEDEFNIVWYNNITSVKSYLKGHIKFNDGNNYKYDDESSPKYLNFDFVFLVYNEDADEILVFDDVDVNQLGSMETDMNGYIILYVSYTELNNNFLFKFDDSYLTTEFTKSVGIDTEHPVEVNGVNYYPVRYTGGEIG